MQSSRTRPLVLRLAERKWLLAAFFLMCLLPLVYPSLYWLLILTSVLAMAVFALSYDIMLGQTGILSFGHAACFGLGAYGVYWMIQAGYPFVFAVVVAMLLASLTNVAMGVSLVRIKGVYFAMFTLAFAEVIHLFLEKQVSITGGSTGVTAPRPQSIQDPAITLLFVALFAATAIAIGYVLVSFYMRRGEHAKALIGLVTVLVIGSYGIYDFGTVVQVLMDGPRGAIWAFTINTYLLSVLILILSYYLVSRLAKSRLGSVLIAVRENEDRTKMLGYNTSLYKVASLAMAGLLAGLAGAMFGSFVQFILTPDLLGSSYTLDVLLYSILGGIGTLIGPIVGAFVIEFLHLNIGDIAQWIGIPSLSQWWMLIIGAFYILIVLFVPYGIVGTLIGRSANVRRIFRRLLGRET